MYSRASVNSNWGYVLKMVSVTQKQDHLRMNVAPDQTGLQGCISCGILVSGIGARGVSSEHMENMDMFSLSPT